jgi:hypothetical protein
VSALRSGSTLRQGFSPIALEILHSYVFAGANSNRRLAIPLQTNGLRVII